MLNSFSLRIGCPVLRSVQQNVGRWNPGRAPRDSASLSDVCFKFIQPFSCCPEGDKGLLFCWLRADWDADGENVSKSSLQAPHKAIRVPLSFISSAPAVLHIYYPLSVPYAAVCWPCVIGCKWVSSFWPARCCLDDNYCQHQMSALLLIRESHKPDMTLELQAEAEADKEKLWWTKKTVSLRKVGTVQEQLPRNKRISTKPAGVILRRVVFIVTVTKLHRAKVF